ncbi:hypothetical protein JCM6882_003838 [Rhodosporidiobolus microsporus]
MPVFLRFNTAPRSKIAEHPSSFNLDHPSYLDPLSRYRWHCAHDAEYQRFSRTFPAPEFLLPNGLMATYRDTAFSRSSRGLEPSITSDLLALHEALEVEWLKGLRHAQEVDELALKCKEELRGSREDRYEWVGARERRRKRQDDVLWLDALWDRCIAFEAEHGVKDVDRVRRRFKRFKLGEWSTLEERDEAERREERAGGEG